MFDLLVSAKTYVFSKWAKVLFPLECILVMVNSPHCQKFNSGGEILNSSKMNLSLLSVSYSPKFSMTLSTLFGMLGFLCQCFKKTNGSIGLHRSTVLQDLEHY